MGEAPGGRCNGVQKTGGAPIRGIWPAFTI